eukprot:CAMPEP_0183300834 /NCGR_PEP_ID=MMETSP0160_2-20130417/7127_2 /TAXON_ID=2839 ORGANISM="Odontella Sinensis, Strain Grunow 1884" /NCGR_SAMPLE_ID=MMETSP0160_2 /ASSEMBLY_ACC=CAM_ASM_000250 /LENGTH=196 /DNA_ID=CAMNT_0025463325 /DNA_START=222 /DNA_END=811 /DNA_ORIENTATION=-
MVTGNPFSPKSETMARMRFPKRSSSISTLFSPSAPVSEFVISCKCLYLGLLDPQSPSARSSARRPTGSLQKLRRLPQPCQDDEASPILQTFFAPHGLTPFVDPQDLAALGPPRTTVLPQVPLGSEITPHPRNVGGIVSGAVPDVVEDGVLKAVVPNEGNVAAPRRLVEGCVALRVGVGLRGVVPDPDGMEVPGEGK